MNKIVYHIFPFYRNWKANSAIKTQMFPKNEQGEDVEPVGVLKDVEDPSNISTKKLEELYDRTLKTKGKIEDKAKTNVMGVTIAVSLIVGAIGLLPSINTKFENAWMSFCAIFFLTVSIIYMLLSGLFALYVMMDENEIYHVALSSIAKGEKELRCGYDKCIAQNQRKNMIRNNYVFTSYICIRNSLVCLFIFFLFIIYSNFALQKYTPTYENSGSPSEKHASMHIFAGFVPTASAAPPESLAVVLVFLPHPESSAFAVVRQTVP